jgi:AraC family transcriptional activator FtrA
MSHEVTILAGPEPSLFELACVVRIFATPPSVLGFEPYRVTVCSEREEPVRVLGGVDLQIRHGLEALHRADTIVVVPNWYPLTEPPSTSVRHGLRCAHGRGARLVSVCTGAFALGHSGLLRGRRATTHWSHFPQFRHQFPDTELVDDMLYVEDGGVATAAGSAAALDLCLHLVRQDHGEGVASQCARYALIAPFRGANHPQLVQAPVPRMRARRIADLLPMWIQRLDQPHTLASMASEAACSPRTLTRRFRQELGVAPHQWLQEIRLRRACELLELERLSIEEVAAGVGFTSAQAFRVQFKARFGRSPTDYRRGFRPSAATGPRRVPRMLEPAS